LERVVDKTRFLKVLPDEKDIILSIFGQKNDA